MIFFNLFIFHYYCWLSFLFLVKKELRDLWKRKGFSNLDVKVTLWNKGEPLRRKPKRNPSHLWHLIWVRLQCYKVGYEHDQIIIIFGFVRFWALMNGFNLIMVAVVWDSTDYQWQFLGDLWRRLGWWCLWPEP